MVLLIFSSLTSKWTPWWKSCAILVFLSVLQKTERDQFIYIVDIEGNGNTNVVILVNILMDSIYQTLAVLVISLAYKQ